MRQGKELRRAIVPAALVLGIIAGGAQGAAAKITPTPDFASVSRTAADRLARSIVVDPKILRGASFSVLPPGGRPTAISTTPLAGFPLAGDDFAIMSTGDATIAGNKNTAPDSGTTVNGPFLRGARDVTILRIAFKTPADANCLSIRFRFLSEEFPEFKNSEFNDGFMAELDKSTWRASSNTNPAIVSPRNFAFGSNGRRISVNKTDASSVKAKRAKGTTYDGATRLLRASTPVGSGNHRLYLSIFDQGDRIYDSAVFLDRMTVDRRSSCKAGTVPEAG